MSIKLVRIGFFALCSTLLLSFHADADGKLGVCYRCEYSSGAKTHRWIKDTFFFGSVTKKDVLCGGGEHITATGVYDGDPQLCDLEAGIKRHPVQNDPFSRCLHSRSNHEVWIGGENGDLLAFNNHGGALASGGFHRIQDGVNFNCGIDVQQGNKFTALRYGKNRDLITIYVRDGDNSQDFKINIPDGYFHNMQSGANYVAIMAGHHKDQLHLYGIGSKGQVVYYTEFVNNGRYHDLYLIDGNEVGVIAGQNSDMRRKYCFENDKWSRAMPTGVGHPFPETCTEALTPK